MTSMIGTKISDNIPIPKIYPPNGWGAAFFLKIKPAGWPGNHVFGFSHPFWRYIIGIGILLDVFSLLWGGVFPTMGGIFLIMGCIFQQLSSE